MHDTRSIDLLKKLISFDTTSCYSNLDLIRFIADYLDEHGIESELVYDATGKKANLFATIAGPDDIAGIVFSGHTDVVPVTDQNWTVDPFSLTEDDGKLFGRGSTDMKGFIAVCLALTKQIREAKLQQPVHFAFSYDEEVGCFGVRTLLDELKTRELIPAACIVGEPTSMQPMNGHKGYVGQRVHVHGHACHSSRTDEGLNAVEYAARIISFLQDLGERIEQNGPFDKDLIPPYTSIHTGPVQGGTALNIVPEHCSFEFELRNIPGHDADEILEQIKDFAYTELLSRMKKRNHKADIRFESLSGVPAFHADQKDPLARLCLGLGSHDKTGKISFCTEAGLFQQLGMQAIVCGPGDIHQAHKPDEFIRIDQITQCENFLLQIVNHATRHMI